MKHCFKDWSQSTTDNGVLKLSTALKPMLCLVVLIWANTYNASLKLSITFIKRWFIRIYVKERLKLLKI